VREIGNDPPGDWSTKRRAKYLKWAKKVVEALGEVNPDLQKAFEETVANGQSKLDAESGDTSEHNAAE